jgi:NAD(P)-dependent dehydrogenase (short-subunit alcohol dehydrogenase family)
VSCGLCIGRIKPAKSKKERENSKMFGRLKDKVALVTGAGSGGPGWGNGKAAAVLFAREGALIFGVDVNRSAAEETRGIIEQEGGQCDVYHADISDSTQVQGMVDKCIETYGRIDILHNNVGILELGGIVDTTEESWDRVIAINLKSQFLTCKYVIPHMLNQGGGAIINISAIAGIRYTGVPYISYSVTKAAILQLTQSIALEYAQKNIRANAILPGLMDTPMVRHKVFQKGYSAADVNEMIRVRNEQCPMKRMGDAWDVAYAALFLASEEAKYITGTQLIVDGGMTAKFV